MLVHLLIEDLEKRTTGLRPLRVKLRFLIPACENVVVHLILTGLILDYTIENNKKKGMVNLTQIQLNQFISRPKSGPGKLN